MHSYIWLCYVITYRIRFGMPSSIGCSFGSLAKVMELGVYLFGRFLFTAQLVTGNFLYLS